MEVMTTGCAASFISVHEVCKAHCAAVGGVISKRCQVLKGSAPTIVASRPHLPQQHRQENGAHTKLRLFVRQMRGVKTGRAEANKHGSCAEKEHPIHSAAPSLQ